MNELKQFEPIFHEKLHFDSDFWFDLEEKIRNVTMPWSYAQCEKSGRIDAFRLHWKPNSSIPKPHYFWDSDVAKWVESAALILQKKEDEELRKKMEYVVDLIISAQQPDGYLNVYFTIVEPKKRWVNLRDYHELYCAGHLIEAAVEHFKATKNPRFLNAMCKYADYIDSVFGVEPGKKRGYCGHEEIELALIKLYNVTNNEKYLTLSKYFIDERGQDPLYFWEEAKLRGEQIEPMIKMYEPHPEILGYGRDLRVYQAHLPVRDQDEAVGHAVRANYLYTGMADVAIQTSDLELLNVCKTLWNDMTSKKMYVTGGLGQARENEGFMLPYLLPNHTAYAETCAAIAFAFFTHRLLQTELDSKYADYLELEMYNGILAALSLSGDKMFYENPLALDSKKRKYQRSSWFVCSCCPNNLTRFYSSLGQYMISKSLKNDIIAIHQYGSYSTAMEISGTLIGLKMESGFPWDGLVNLEVDVKQSVDFILAIRIPGWCKNFAIVINDQNLTKDLKEKIINGYLMIERKWESNTKISLEFEMRTQILRSYPAVKENVGKIAVRRGPIIYCFESMVSGDNIDPESLFIKSNAWITERLVKNDMGQYIEIDMKAEKIEFPTENCSLYTNQQPKSVPINITLIPYFMWCNRGESNMTVWLNEKL